MNFGLRIRAALAALLSLVKSLDFEMLIQILPQVRDLLAFATDRAGFRRWLRSVAAVLDMVSARTPTVRDDAAVDLLFHAIDDDATYERLYTLLFAGDEPPLPRLVALQDAGDGEFSRAQLLDLLEHVLPMLLEWIGLLIEDHHARHRPLPRC